MEYRIRVGGCDGDGDVTTTVIDRSIRGKGKAGGRPGRCPGHNVGCKVQGCKGGGWVR